MLWFWKSAIIQFFLANILIKVSVTQDVEPQLNTSDPYDNLIRSVFHDLADIDLNQTKHEKINIRDRMLSYDCITPNSDDGFCMPIKNCTKLIHELMNPKINKTFLRESYCGTKQDEKANPRVCCGKYSSFKRSENPWPSTCGYQNVTVRGRILGGKEAALGEFPWLARLYHKDKRDVKTFGCTGFLITSTFVLTAAHCLEGENVKNLGPVFEVRLGDHNTNTEIDCNTKNTTCALKLQKIRVKDIFINPNYDSHSIHHHNDIGLIRLKKEAKFTTYVSPICLVKKYDFKPFEYWVSGWGQTERSNLNPIKLKVSVPPFSHANCTELYSQLQLKITHRQLCAGGKRNQDSCTGDSGGPLMLVKDSKHWFAAGVVSYGYGCGREGWPGIYTNITSYVSWIKKTIQGNVSVKSRKKSHQKTNSTVLV